MQIYGKDDNVRKTIESPEYKDYLRNVLANKKVIELLKDLIIK